MLRDRAERVAAVIAGLATPAISGVELLYGSTSCTRTGVFAVGDRPARFGQAGGVGVGLGRRAPQPGAKSCLRGLHLG
jgi:hypothetical protein